MLSRCNSSQLLEHKLYSIKIKKKTASKFHHHYQTKCRQNKKEIEENIHIHEKL